MTEFFMPMLPPTVTAQERAVRVVHNRPVFYDPPRVRDARDWLCANLAKHRPREPYRRGVRLVVKRCFKLSDGIAVICGAYGCCGVPYPHVGPRGGGTVKAEGSPETKMRMIKEEEKE